MNVSVWRSTQTHLLPLQRKISIILNLTGHSSNSERLVIIIHGEIKVLMLLVKKKKKKDRVGGEKRKIRYKSWEIVEQSVAFSGNVCVSVY